MLPFWPARARHARLTAGPVASSISGEGGKQSQSQLPVLYLAVVLHPATRASGVSFLVVSLVTSLQEYKHFWILQEYKHFWV